MFSEDSTVLLVNLKDALASSEEEAKENPAALLAVGGELNSALFDLNKAEVTVGRSADNIISLDLQGVSRHHFKIVAHLNGHAIEDSGSKNGTYLNNKKLDSLTPLKKGDIIKIGNIALKYIPKGDPERLTYDKLNKEVHTDGLTQCYNKAYFNNALESEFKKSKITGTPLSLIIFDLDFFKSINDNYGHNAGDFVLKEMAETIQKNGVREQDIFARYGGEEFVILLPNTNLKATFEIAERLRKLIETHAFLYEDKRLPVTASIGIADFRSGVLTALDLFKRADTAVYKSKQNGRNQVNFFKA